MITTPKTEIARNATHIRGTHPYAFRSGQWARIVSRDTRLSDGRPTVLVEFSDGVTDVWVLDDEAAGWEFDPTTSPVERCPTCVNAEGYDRLSGPCPTCHGESVIPPGSGGA